MNKKGLDDVTDSMSRMERKSKDGTKSVGSLSKAERLV